MNFISNESSESMEIEKIKILVALLKLPAKQHRRFDFEVNGLNWQCCLAGRSKRAPRILIFSIVMDADNSFYAKFIATFVPTLFGFIIPVLVIINYET